MEPPWQSVWQSKWDTDFNPSKCQVVRMTTSRRPTNTLYYVHWHVLEALNTWGWYLSWPVLDTDRIFGNANRTFGLLKRNIKAKRERLPIILLYVPSWSMRPPCGIPTLRKNILQIEKTQRQAARWTTGDYKTRSSVTAMMENLGWRKREQRQADAHLPIFYAIVHVLVVIPIPAYISSRKPCCLKIATNWHYVRSISVGTSINIHSFLLP